jgi:hypothetical protein
VTGGQALAELLERSDERDQWHRFAWAMWREGWQAAERAHADDYHRGYVDGAAARKHAQHAALEALDVYLRRWKLRGQPRGRGTFSQPAEGDFQGREGVA